MGECSVSSCQSTNWAASHDSTSAVVQIHFVPVSWHDLEDDLPRKVKWAMEHDAEAQRIMLNGHRWVMTHLTDANVAWFQEQVCFVFQPSVPLSVSLGSPWGIQLSREGP